MPAIHQRSPASWGLDAESLRVARLAIEASSFRNRQIRVADLLAVPGQPVVGKAFEGCGLHGPAVIVFFGSSVVRNNQIINCDFVKIREPTRIFNVVAFKDATVIDGSLHNLTILVPPHLVRAFPGANWITA